MSEKVIKFDSVKKYFPIKSRFLDKLTGAEENFVHAVNNISFEIKKGEIFSLVGETGSGKTTSGKLAVNLLKPTSGKIYFKDKDLSNMNKKETHVFRRNIGMVFQDPLASLNPRQTVENIVGFPIKIHENLTTSERRERVIKILDKVGLRPPEKIIKRHPHTFSGGQRQRIGIARAIALNPEFIVLDEPVSSLDVSIRAQILNLLKELKNEYQLTYLLIAHDLTVVRYMSDWIFVMYLGTQVELAKTKDLFTSPKHPYLKALLSAIPIPDPTKELKHVTLKGEIPSPINPPSGCTFHTRCPHVMSICKEMKPEFIEIETDHWVSCHKFTNR